MSSIGEREDAYAVSETGQDVEGMHMRDTNLPRSVSQISLRSGISSASSTSSRSRREKMEKARRKAELQDQLDEEKHRSAMAQRKIVREMEYLECEDMEEDGCCNEDDITTVPPNRTSLEGRYTSVEVPTTYFRVESKENAGNMKTAVTCEKSEREPSEVKMLLARQSVGKELPTFYGDSEEWPAWISQLERSTQVCGFSEDENICRLQKCLKGSAYESVRCLLVAGGNFDDVVKTLRKRFGQPDAIMQSLMEEARTVRAPVPGNMDTLMDFGIAVKNLAVTARTLKAPEYLMNPQLLLELVTKLPDHMKITYGVYCKRLEPKRADIGDFAEWMDEVTDAAMMVSIPKGSRLRKHQDSNIHNNRWKGNHRREASFVAVEETKCPVCSSQKHSMEKCDQFKRMEVPERWSTVKKVRACFCCLGLGHGASKCSRRKKCDVRGCEKDGHHTLLHTPMKPTPRNAFERRFGEVNNSWNQDGGIRDGQFQMQPPRNEFFPRQPVQPPAPAQAFNGHSHTSGSTQVLLRVVPVTLRGPKGSIPAHALCDEGSTLSMIDADVARMLGLEGDKSPLSLSWLDGQRKTENSSRVPLWISGKFGEEFEIENVRTVSNLKLPVQTVSMVKMRSNWDHLRQVPVEDVENARPVILLGQDNIHLTVPRRIVEGPINAPVATLTKLGWILHGNNNYFRGRVDEGISYLTVGENQDEELNQLVRDQFRFDALGVSRSVTLRSKEDDQAERMMEQLSRRVGDAWETGLLWKEGNMVLPESKKAALRRLNILEKQMDKDESFADLYASKIDEYLQKGFCRKLSREESAREGSQTWYLPHFGTTNPNKPGKVRLVFDCAAKANGMSLNDALLQGPDLMTPLMSVLCKFREKEVAFSGDIRDMFHRVKIRKDDQGALRFLWRGRDRTRPPDVYVMQVMIFGAVSSPYQAQWVKNRNAEDFKTEFDEHVGAIVDNHYVDDYLDSEETPEKAVTKIQSIREIHRRGGFEIRNWTCNVPAVLKEVAPDEVEAEDTKDLGDEQEKIERVLGLYWKSKDDVFTFKKRFRTVSEDIVEGRRLPTKRELFKLMMCLYDPLGFVGHLTIRAKILIQDVWRSGIGWDDELPVSMERKWKIFVEQLGSIEDVRIRRCYLPKLEQPDGDVQLHVFCDASEQAFCCVAYFRTEINGEVYSNIVVGKTRVAPLKPTSIPRMELQAALVGSRIASWIKENHTMKISSTTFWTDSKTVLCWLRSEDPKHFKIFVAHRVGEIQELTDVKDWRWVPTKENVADDGTRDAVPADLQPDSRWFRGPAFLKLQPSEWPVEKDMEKVNAEDLEMRKDVALVVHVDENLPDVGTDTWPAYALRIAKLSTGEEEPTREDIMGAEKRILKKVQWESFPDEMSALSRGKEISRSSKLKALNPELDDGLMRMRGRVEKSPDLTLGTRLPLILDCSHPVTKAIVDDLHRSLNHQGQEAVTNELRQRYWILGIRSAVRAAWKRCEECRKTNAKPLKPMMAALPEFRVTRVDRPFSQVGIDFFGPIEVAFMRRRPKRYGVILTCLNTRAVHLEITHDMTTDCTLMAIERFISRRGVPEKIWSDNGRNLVGANAEMGRALRECKDELEQKLMRKKISWNFIPPLSPHFGGAWERLVRSVKTTMKAILKDAVPTDEMLLTVMCEAEATVNSRPLTFVSMDADSPEAITPNLLLMGTTSVLCPPGDFSNAHVGHKKRWRICQQLADHFWKRWVREFLPSLAPRRKWTDSCRNLQVGEKVLIVDTNLPRNSWLTGCVTKTFPGQDGAVRVADVKTAAGTFRRPVVKLCPIGLVDEEPESGDNPGCSTGGGMCTRALTPSSIHPNVHEEIKAPAATVANET